MPDPSELSHIPHLPTQPLVGHTLLSLRDFLGFAQRNTEAFGEVYRIKMMGRWRISLTSAEAAEYILMDPDRIFSSQQGWQDSLGALFPGGLMLRDFDDHRQHRRIMQAAFRKPAMDSYLSLMAPDLERLVADWPVDRPFKFYPAIKDLTLRVGAHVFMGLPADAEGTRALNRRFIEEIAAAITVVRKPLPLTRFRRGIQARAALIARFHALVAERRGAGGEDFFSQMCRATDEEGRRWSGAEIADHFNFLMMAAHDTTASGLSTMVWALTAHPEWQERLIAEVDALGAGPMTPAMLDAMPLTDMVFKEALRLVPPVALIPRVALRDFDWKGVHIPAGHPVAAQLTMVMRSPKLFTDPDRFDPERFSDTRAEDRRHRFAWAPFGGGAHKCIGLHFGTMQVKSFIRALLSRTRIKSADGVPVDWKRLPIPQPKGGLPVVLEARA
ncbi:cytochrome P450 [Maliponia aquimaris]|uniref:Putative cytochrome P450 120 n=1 Tax=Maliponia aquimaris TaxID=1673631 RepID=A0A238K8H1_9RHOB|nr:cytochrome P450 [Maliponia aquimaris]SMX39190.1 Putative cytochrome P450 120 [Maliponia aquimaris]